MYKFTALISLVLASRLLPFRETGCLPLLISGFVYRSSACLIGAEARELALCSTSTKVSYKCGQVNC